jgi:hypothetical protein
MSLNPATPNAANSLETRVIVRRNGGTESVTETHKVAAAALATWKTTYSIVVGTAHAVEASCKLSRITEPTEGTREIVDVVLEYTNPLFEQGAGRYRDLPVGTVFLESSSNRNEIEVIEYGDTDPSTGTTRETPATRAIVEATFSRTEIVAASGWTWTQANVIGNTNVREAPTGMAGTPTTNAWLNIGRQVSQEGDKIIVTDTWAYNPQLWPDPL